LPSSRTRSAHWIRHPGLFSGLRDYLREEARGVEQQMQGLSEYLPYRRDPVS
jgi:predicted N-acyltransferase